MLREHVPQGHKVGLLDLKEGAPIIRHDEVIGFASRAIPRGSCVVGSLVRIPDVPSLDNLPLATKVPPPPVPLDGFTFEKMVPEWLLADARPALTTGTSDNIVHLQDERHRGFDDMISRRAWKRPRTHLAVLNTRKFTTCPASDLVVGMKCGGSDAFSGMTANPAVGFAADLLVRAGQR